MKICPLVYILRIKLDTVDVANFVKSARSESHWQLRGRKSNYSYTCTVTHTEILTVINALVSVSVTLRSAPCGHSGQLRTALPQHFQRNTEGTLFTKILLSAWMV